MDKLMELAERLQKQAEQERGYAANNSIVADLLAPEVAKFEERIPYNLYAVRMAIDHRNSAKKDAAFADDLEQAAAALRARATQGRVTSD